MHVRTCVWDIAFLYMRTYVVSVGLRVCVRTCVCVCVRMRVGVGGEGGGVGKECADIPTCVVSIVLSIPRGYFVTTTFECPTLHSTHTPTLTG